MGTNPIAMAAPGKAQDNFELDMATSVVASGKVRKGTALPSLSQDGRIPLPKTEQTFSSFI